MEMWTKEQMMLLSKEQIIERFLPVANEIYNQLKEAARENQLLKGQIAGFEQAATLFKAGFKAGNEQ